jgi:hypothetical protein
MNYNNYVEIPSEVVSEVFDNMVHDPKVHIIYHPTGIGNGPPIAELTRISQEDNIMLLEEDGFIFNSDVVAKCFQRIESGEVDAVGSPRNSCGDEVVEALRIKYNLDYATTPDMPDSGPNYWPNFFFVKREDLLKTDLDCGSKVFEAGYYSPELDHTFKETNCADTFVWMCIQLRAHGVRFAHVRQFHADPNEIQSKKNGIVNWNGSQMDWIHGGSLSSGWGGFINVVPADQIQATEELETRFAFWSLCADSVPGFTDFKKAYKDGIENQINNTMLDRDRINQKYQIYKELMRV